MTDLQNHLARALQQHALVNYNKPGYWDWLYECHDTQELVDEFVKDRKSLQAILRSKDLKLFFKCLRIKDENSRP
jgi:hypothetical protein|tara:strand:- start:745 stop:969 length:225 start_codon:yes stop_codon:yes gene_type:complete